MHTNVILTNKRRTNAQSNYTDTKLKAWFRHLLHHPARKWTGPNLQPQDPHGATSTTKTTTTTTNTTTTTMQTEWKALDKEWKTVTGEWCNHNLTFQPISCITTTLLLLLQLQQLQLQQQRLLNYNYVDLDKDCKKISGEHCCHSCNFMLSCTTTTLLLQQVLLRLRLLLRLLQLCYLDKEWQEVTVECCRCCRNFMFQPISSTSQSTCTHWDLHNQSLATVTGKWWHPQLTARDTIQSSGHHIPETLMHAMSCVLYVDLEH